MCRDFKVVFHATMVKDKPQMAIKYDDMMFHKRQRSAPYWCDGGRQLQFITQQSRLACLSVCTVHFSLQISADLTLYGS